MQDLFDFFKVSITVSVGLGLGYVGCALIYAMKTKTILGIEAPPPLQPIKYRDRYKLDLSGDKLDDGGFESVKHRAIYEYSPNGGIMLKYNDEDHIFEYWGSSTISYEALCVSIRKYCLQFHCIHLYQDSEQESDKKDNDKNEIADEDRELFIFSNPKKPTEKKTIDDISGNTKEIKQKLPKIKIRCIGTLEDYDILTGDKKYIDDSTEIISWAEFKKIKENM